MRAAIVLLLALWPTFGTAACRQALVLALDVSGSVDETEYALQRDGVAAALGSQAVREMLLAPGAAPTQLAVFEWSGPEDQAMILPWWEISDEASLNGAIARILNHERPYQGPTTAIGSAMRFGFRLLAQQPECWKHTLDISGDGEANTGPRPQFVTTDEAPAGTIVNGLVIGQGDAGGGDHTAANVRELSTYFEAYVIRGPGAFVEVALGFEDYAAAMERKLIRELQSVALSRRADQ